MSLDRFIAMESIISKFRNRKVTPANYTNKANLPQYRNTDEILDAALSSDIDEKFGGQMIEGKIEGICYLIHIVDKNDTIIEKLRKAMKRIHPQIGKVQEFLAKTIVAEYNSSNGDDGPWEWTETDDEFSQKKTSDVTSKITLETIDIRVTEKKGIDCTLWFADGNLYWGHAIVVSNIFDEDGKLTPSTMKYSVEG